MVNKKLGLGILVMILVFGMMGCSEDDDDKPEHNMLDKMNLSSGEPSALDKYGLDSTKFNAIITAASGGYKGYEVDGGFLYMVWTDRSSSSFTAVADLLKTTFSITNDGRTTGEVHSAKGEVTSPTWRRIYSLDFYPKKYFWSSNSYFPAGTMILEIPRTSS